METINVKVQDDELVRVINLGDGGKDLHFSVDGAMVLYRELNDKLQLHVATRAPTVPEILEGAANTFRERNKLYGDNYKHFGQTILSAFGGEIPQIKNVDDANRLGIIVQCISKMTRYCQNFKVGGHSDSAHDSVVYNAMLEEITKI